MLKKIAGVLVALCLFLLPFLMGIPLTRHTPYVDTNSFSTYVIIWSILSLVVVAATVSSGKYFSRTGPWPATGMLLFFLVCPIFGIVGLAAAPDLSIKILEHPEREHLRYIFLFIAAILFGAFSYYLFKSDFLKNRNTARRLFTLLVILAFAEFIWEFSHHYSYPEAMKAWIGQGNQADTFSKQYDSLGVINLGVLGRLIQFSLIIWLAVLLYKQRYIRIWAPVLILLLGLTGIVTAVLIYFTQMNLPKGLETLMLFFIPGIPFLLLYWLGVTWLTKSGKHAISH